MLFENTTFEPDNVGRDPGGSDKIAKTQSAASAKDCIHGVTVKASYRDACQDADREKRYELDDSPAQQEVVNYGIKTGDRNKRKNWIIIHTPIVGVVNNLLIDQALRVVDIPSFVVVLLEKEADRKQVSSRQNDCVDQDEASKNGQKPRADAR